MQPLHSLTSLSCCPSPGHPSANCLSHLTYSLYNHSWWPTANVQTVLMAHESCAGVCNYSLQASVDTGHWPDTPPMRNCSSHCQECFQQMLSAVSPSGIPSPGESRHSAFPFPGWPRPVTRYRPGDLRGSWLTWLWRVILTPKLLPVGSTQVIISWSHGWNCPSFYLLPSPSFHRCRFQDLTLQITFFAKFCFRFCFLKSPISESGRFYY